MKNIKKSKYEKLMSLDPFHEDQSKRKKLFLEAINESYYHHFKNCEPYKNFCERRGFSLKKEFDSILDIPSMPVQSFKQYGSFLRSSSNLKKDNLILQSSATSGNPSSISVDRITSKRQVICMSKVLMSFIGSTRRPFIVVDVNPKYSSSNTLGARSAATTGFLNFAKDAIYLLKENKGSIELDNEAIELAIEKFNKKELDPIIFGFTYVLYEQILNNPNFKKTKFGKNAFLLHIGGWKKLENEKISKKDFNKYVGINLGISKRNIVDVYGFTEQMGLIYPSFDEEYKTTSIFSEVIVRDPVTFEPLENGKEGILQFISPMPYSYPGLSITTDDIGIVKGFGFNKLSGLYGNQFTITGRAKNAEVRGCGDIMSEYVKVNKKSTSIKKNKEISMLYKGGLKVDKKNYFENLSTTNLPKISSLKELRCELLEKRAKLDEYSVDELISYLSEISKTWIDDPALVQFKQHGLSFLMNWLNSSNLRIMANQALNGQRSILDDFATDTFQPNRQILASPRGLVSHWLAGNVPLLGMLALAQSIITKNANILRAPSKNTGVLPALLSTFSKTNIKLKTGRTIFGKDIADTIALIHFSRDDISSSEELSLIADARIAWGGKEAVESVLSLPKKHTCEDIVFGPKLSFMAIGKESLSKDMNLNKLFRRVATDASVFDQYACASPHTIFVEEGGDMSAKEFASNLAIHMEKAAKRIPKEGADAGTAGDINSKRMLYEFTSELWHSNDTTWTVLYDKNGEQGLVDPTYSRVITVRSIRNILDAAEFANQDIQTIGLSMNNEKKLKFAKVAAIKGAARFPDIGRMTFFDSPWDGLQLIQRLVRHISMGGPFN